MNRHLTRHSREVLIAGTGWLAFCVTAVASPPAALATLGIAAHQARRRIRSERDAEAQARAAHIERWGW